MGGLGGGGWSAQRRKTPVGRNRRIADRAVVLVVARRPGRRRRRSRHPSRPRPGCAPRAARASTGAAVFAMRRTARGRRSDRRRPIRAPCRSGAGRPAGSQAQHLTRRVSTDRASCRRCRRPGRLREDGPSRSPVGRDDDHHVRGGQQRVEADTSARPVRVAERVTCGSWKATSAPRSARPAMTSAAGELRASWTLGLKATPRTPTRAPLSALPRSLSASAARSTTWRGIAKLMSPASSMKRSMKSNSRARHDR